MDVSDNDSVSEAFKKAIDAFGRLDILANSAGTMPLTILKHQHLEEWLNTMEVNVKGVLRCVNSALTQMKKQNSRHIINIASIDGKEYYEGGSVYSASKAALITLSKVMRMELSPEFNIRITSIEPGTVNTNLRGDISDKEFLKDKDYDKNESKLKPEDIAEAVLYAVSQPDGVNVNEILITPTGAG